jgi:hypothetical protein
MVDTAEDTKRKAKFFRIGLKIEQMKSTRAEIVEFVINSRFIEDSERQDLMDIINAYIKGDEIDYIADISQTSGDMIKKILDEFGIHHSD